MASDYYNCGSVDVKVRHDHEEKYDKNDLMCNKLKVKFKKTKYHNLPIKYKKDEDELLVKWYISEDTYIMIRKNIYDEWILKDGKISELNRRKSI